MAPEYLYAWSIYLGAAAVTLGAGWFVIGWLLRGLGRQTLWLCMLVVALLPWPLADVLALHDVATDAAGPLWAPAVIIVLFATVFEGIQHAMPPLTGLTIGLALVLAQALVRALLQRASR